MKAVKADLSRDLKEIEIFTFADWHIGDVGCNIGEIKKMVKAVAEGDNRFAICNGDLMNNATKTSVSDSYAERFTPQRQIDILTEVLEPIKDKILVMTQGNHEARTYRMDGIDLTAIVAGRLGILDRYVREGGVVFLRFGELSKGLKEGNTDVVRRVCYTLYVTHGSGGGRKEGAKAIRLADLASIVDCDIYVHSHTHLPLIMKQSFYRIATTNSSVANVEKLFVNSSAQLEYGGYGQTAAFKPSSLSNPVIYLNGTRHEMTAKM